MMMRIESVLCILENRNDDRRSDQRLNPYTINVAGLLDAKDAGSLFELHEAPNTSAVTEIQLNAVIQDL